MWQIVKSHYKTIIKISVVIALVAGYFLIDFNSIYKKIKPENSFITQSSDCNLHKKECRVVVDENSSFTLEIFPKPIPLMKKLRFQIKSEDKSIENLTIKVYTTNMFMGEFSHKLKKIEDGVFEAYVTLPSCKVGNMKWNVDLEKSGFSKSTGARFQFKTGL